MQHFQKTSRLGGSYFMFPHGNPTYHYQSSSRAPRHLWARNNRKSSPLYFCGGITGRRRGQLMLQVRSSQSCQSRPPSSRFTAKGQALFCRLQNRCSPSSSALEGMGGRRGGGKGAHMPLCVLKSIFKCDWHSRRGLV